MNGRASRPFDRRGLSAPSATALVLLVLLAGTIGWLWLTGPESLPGSPAVLVTALPPSLPPKVEMRAAPTPPVTTTPGPAAAPRAALPAAPAKSPPSTQTPATRPAGTPTREAALEPAPIPELTERGKLGPLPRIAANGRKPWQAYARPFDRADKRPRIAIVISNLGLSGAATEAAIQELPGAVTLAFSPYSRELGQDIPLARAGGHEVLLSLPMEPVLPADDAGPNALLTALTPSENLERLTWMLSRFVGYVGVTNYLGDRFAASDRDMRPILTELRRRGLLFFDSRARIDSIATRLESEIGIPATRNGRFIDREASRVAIDRMLRATEEEALRTGRSVAVGFPYPVTIERLALWVRTLDDKGIALAPISALVRENGNG